MAMTRAEKKLAAIKRAERRLQHRLDDIDWELDVLAPEIAKLKELEAAGQEVHVELEAGSAPEDH